MTRVLFFVMAVVNILLSAANAFAQTKATDFYDVYSDDYSKEVVHFLTQDKLKGRKVGTAQGKAAARFIVREFEKMGYDVSMQKATDSDLTSIIGEPRTDRPSYPKYLNNVIARRDGKDAHKYVVIGAHFDAKGLDEQGRIRVGADDNASGIAVLLSLAKMIVEADVVPEYTILFCAWDGEEDGIGMLGSRYYVGNWYNERESETCCEGHNHTQDSIVLYMNFDMMGRTKTPDNPAVTFAWNNNYPYLLDICKDAQKEVPQPLQVLLEERTGDGKGGSDYMPFSAHNIPFIAWMEDELHEDYHKYTDTPDKLHWDKLHKSTLLAWSVLWRLVVE